MRALRLMLIVALAALLVTGCDWFDDLRTKTLNYRLHDFDVEVDFNGGISQSRRLDFADDPDWEDIEDHLDKIEDSEFSLTVSSNGATGEVDVTVVVDSDSTPENGNEEDGGSVEISGGTGTFENSGDDGVLENAVRRGFAYIYLRTGEYQDEDATITVGTLDVTVDAVYEP